ncbi:helix-turn-helix protein [Kitasatospora sp. SolWspMP-SS2h]|uniref:helix-turn-helix domain-containing protein n=1 Tax=Kitasatospora sp. SolWspMP-SS2h TaxID=1305729 RepID=UPI000DBF4404|nr:helix-turn-helix transcriptional regulator [Kitasatospora sp. SolWspMP-SS2h]RAJ31237.1 helix-turn-helix protein [Kitasatospora sp. SolWspMP-SS2h]
MGRPERPVTERTKESAALAQYLRQLRRRAGLTYSQLGAATGLTASRLSRAASGEAVPPLEVVEAYVRGCGADKKELAAVRTRWRAARQAEAPPPVDRPRDIRLVDTPSELWAAMVHLHRRIGRPSLRQLEKRAGGLGQLPRSTLNLVLRREMPPSPVLLDAFVRACGVPAADAVHWAGAWSRAYTPRSSAVIHPEPRDARFPHPRGSAPATRRGTLAAADGTAPLVGSPRPD